MIQYYIKSNHEMTELANDSIDCVVTSPPYNQGIKYGGLYDDNKPWSEYIAEISKSATEIFRVMKPGAFLWLNTMDKSDDLFKTARLTDAFIKIGFVPRQRFIWHKFNGNPCSAGFTFKNNYEYITLFSKGVAVDPHIDKYLIGIPASDRYMKDVRHDETLQERARFYGLPLADRGSVWSLYTAPKNDFSVTDGEVEHNAEFPVELPYFCIRSCCYGKGKFRVLDPWLGTGTTLVAAKMAGSNPYIRDGKTETADIDAFGYELDPAYEPTILKKLAQPLPTLRIPEDPIRRKQVASYW